MKYRIFAIMQLIVMVFYLGRPLMPHIEYAVFKDYIAKNLCINRGKPKSCCEGKCHLKKQIEKSSEASGNDNKEPSRKGVSHEAKEFINSHVSVPKATAINIPHMVQNELIVKAQVSSVIFVPPKAVFIS